MFLIGATDMGGTPSDGAGGKTINLLWKRGGQLRIFRSGMSCLAKASLFPVLSCFFTLAHRRALLLWHRCHSVSSFISPLPFLPLLLSDFQYLSILFSSAASSKCLQITSTLHLYLCLLGQSCGSMFLFSGRQSSRFSFYFCDYQ